MLYTDLNLKSIDVSKVVLLINTRSLATFVQIAGKRIIEKQEIGPTMISMNFLLKERFEGILICECRSLIRRMDRIVVKHTYWEQNRAADALAKEASKEVFLTSSSILPVPSMFVMMYFGQTSQELIWLDPLWVSIMKTILHNISVVGVLQYPNNDSYV